jgi:hypothetical protein
MFHYTNYAFDEAYYSNGISKRSDDISAGASLPRPSIIHLQNCPLYPEESEG